MLHAHYIPRKINCMNFYKKKVDTLNYKHHTLIYNVVVLTHAIMDIRSAREYTYNRGPRGGGVCVRFYEEKKPIYGLRR